MKHMKAVNTTILTLSLLVYSVSTYSQGKYMNINGLKMYYEIKGVGQPLLFIHGGGLCTEAYQQEINELSEKYMVIAADNQAQGRTNDIERDISYINMANDQLKLIDSLGIDSVIVFGHSDGGVVGLYMTINNPKRVRKLIVSGANYNASGILDEFTELLKNATPEIFQNDYFNKLSPDGPDHWPAVMQKLKKMWLTEPNISDEELHSILKPTLIIVGDHDLIKINHTVELFKKIDNSNLLVVPNASHEVLSEKTEFVFPIIFDFIDK
jgi:pimeloyl-ACP methyl ester carboxylesterase